MFEGHCDYALLPEGWRADVRLRSDAQGRWVDVTPDAPRGELPRLGRWVLPGMPNLHSHAFQRAMAGGAERFVRPDDSFWSWRETMYAHAGRITPETLHAVACWLYCELLEAGYTRVCEFHYVHHQPDGRPYAPSSAMSDALIAAAADSGIGLTLLPVLYQRGGFRDQPLAPRQRRFEHQSADFLRLLSDLQSRPGIRLGAAIHSLRAVAAQPLQALLSEPLLRGRVLHIHIAEQQLEVDECLAVHGQRPVQRLFALAEVDAHYCLVHATHLCDAEIQQIARARAVVGLCPTTEANLGDGLFPLAALRDQHGVWGIGSDSHISLDPREELRWLEYQARLASGRRTVLANAARPEVAANLWLEAQAGGASACGAATAGFRVGADADWVVLDDADPSLSHADPATALASWVFAPARLGPLSVGVDGRQQVVAGRHPRHEQFAAGYRRALAALATS